MVAPDLVQLKEVDRKLDATFDACFLEHKRQLQLMGNFALATFDAGFLEQKRQLHLMDNFALTLAELEATFDFGFPECTRQLDILDDLLNSIQLNRLGDLVNTIRILLNERYENPQPQPQTFYAHNLFDEMLLEPKSTTDEPEAEPISDNSSREFKIGDVVLGTQIVVHDGGKVESTVEEQGVELDFASVEIENQIIDKDMPGKQIFVKDRGKRAVITQGTNIVKNTHAKYCSKGTEGWSRLFVKQVNGRVVAWSPRMTRRISWRVSTGNQWTFNLGNERRESWLGQFGHWPKLNRFQQWCGRIWPALARKKDVHQDLWPRRNGKAHRCLKFGRAPFSEIIKHLPRMGKRTEAWAHRIPKLEGRIEQPWSRRTGHWPKTHRDLPCCHQFERRDDKRIKTKTQEIKIQELGVKTENQNCGGLRPGPRFPRFFSCWSRRIQEIDGQYLRESMIVHQWFYSWRIVEEGIILDLSWKNRGGRYESWSRRIRRMPDNFPIQKWLEQIRADLAQKTKASWSRRIGHRPSNARARNGSARMLAWCRRVAWSSGVVQRSGGRKERWPHRIGYGPSLRRIEQGLELKWLHMARKDSGGRCESWSRRVGNRRQLATFFSWVLIDRNRKHNFGGPPIWNQQIYNGSGWWIFFGLPFSFLKEEDDGFLLGPFLVNFLEKTNCRIHCLLLEDGLTKSIPKELFVNWVTIRGLGFVNFEKWAWICANGLWNFNLENCLDNNGSSIGKLNDFRSDFEV